MTICRQYAAYFKFKNPLTSQENSAYAHLYKEPCLQNVLSDEKKR